MVATNEEVNLIGQQRQEVDEMLQGWVDKRSEYMSRRPFIDQGNQLRKKLDKAERRYEHAVTAYREYVRNLIKFGDKAILAQSWNNQLYKDLVKAAKEVMRLRKQYNQKAAELNDNCQRTAITRAMIDTLTPIRDALDELTN